MKCLECNAEAYKPFGLCRDCLSQYFSDEDMAEADRDAELEVT